jgi:DNA-directed RNA polymerase specialized sigma subunit
MRSDGGGMTEHDRNQIVLGNMGLVRQIVRRELGRGDADMTQEGALALILAVKQYRPSMGRWVSYAGRAVTNRIKLLRAEWGDRPGVRIPWSTQRLTTNHATREAINEARKLQRVGIEFVDHERHYFDPEPSEA